MARLIAALMRHGAYRQPPGVPSAHLPYPLTDAGRAQARDGAAAFADDATARGWQIHPVIYCSTLLRAWQTAAIAADGLCARGQDIAVEATDELCERSVGAAANLTERQIEEIVAEDPRFEPLPRGWKADSACRLPFPGAESLIEAGDRVAAYLRGRAAAMEPGMTGDVVMLFVGHGGAFRHAAAALGTMTVAEAGARSMHHARAVYLEATREGPWRHFAGNWKSRPTPVEAMD